MGSFSICRGPIYHFSKLKLLTRRKTIFSCFVSSGRNLASFSKCAKISKVMISYLEASATVIIEYAQAVQARGFCTFKQSPRPVSVHKGVRPLSAKSDEAPTRLLDPPKRSSFFHRFPRPDIQCRHSTPFPRLRLFGSPRAGSAAQSSSCGKPEDEHGKRGQVQRRLQSRSRSSQVMVLEE